MEPERRGTGTHDDRPPATTSARVVERRDLSGVRAAWDDMVEDATLPSPFLKSWWVENAASGTPLFLLVMDGTGELLGGMALELDFIGPGTGTNDRADLRGAGPGVPRVRAIGQSDLAPDHIDVVAAPLRRNEVLAEVARWFRAQNLVVDLDGLSAECELPWLLKAPVISTEAAPYLPLSRSDPLTHLPGRLRSTIKRSGRRLAKAGFDTRRVATTQARRSIERLLELHDDRWDDGSALGPDREPLIRALVAGAAVGDVIIHELTDDVTVVASEVELRAGSRVCFYQSGRLTDHELRGSGSVLKAEVVRWAAGSGFREFDLLRGLDPYKDDWSLASRSVRRMRTGFGPSGSVAAAAMNLWMRAAPWVRGIRRGGTAA